MNLINQIITRITLLILKPWSNFCLQILIILSIRLLFIEHIYADSWYNLSYWIDLSDAAINMDQAMGYCSDYKEIISPNIEPTVESNTYTEEPQQNDYDENINTLVKTVINNFILLSEQQLTIDELIATLPHFTDPIYELEKGLRYIDTYEYQLLEAELLKTKSLDLLNIVCIKTANHIIYNDYPHAKDPIGLQHQLIINGINAYKTFLNI